MRKKICLVSVVLIFFLFTFNVSYSAEYSVSQLTDNKYEDRDPAISSNGYAVWYGYDGSDYEIYLDLVGNGLTRLPRLRPRGRVAL